MASTEREFIMPIRRDSKGRFTGSGRAGAKASVKRSRSNAAGVTNQDRAIRRSLVSGKPVAITGRQTVQTRTKGKLKSTRGPGYHTRAGLASWKGKSGSVKQYVITPKAKNAAKATLKRKRNKAMTKKR